ncbi:peptide/nickel transport system ATP-binding protein [Streptosporangium becharense]|uniref:Peptide/nickel transport system ATP-binding protein n=1 Tax=Streptosporangium becharense TaxID=1816182 RepID=A0A7W9IM35_9ACTN|nr:ABC transporter ATP-binding protein [Streptosporangium becharense]MBB2910502.1 peptide/nickel transport system ATP-binding protein [Streptosporangium becharense]MBB5823245.1 peptide/nickel transport system ATP-binding protein [Streptosporangium becharense]
MGALEIRGLTVRYGRGKSAVTVLHGIDLDVPDGGVLGLVGESGSGKSTVARAVVGLVRPASGSIRLDGTEVRGAADRRVQMVFQDPYASLNPRMAVGESIEEVLAVHTTLARRDRAAEAARLLDLVHLPAQVTARHPGDLSGGMRQRVAIARALAARPEVLVADEITSALDASVQAAVLNLLRDIRRELGLSMLFISHNLAVVRYVSDEVAVLNLGRVVESGPADELVGAPRHPYTRELVEAVPSLSAPRDYLAG